MFSRLSNRQITLASLVAAGVAAAVANALIARDTERLNPPSGTFIDVDGVRLHYVERGFGEPLVLLHGNGVTLDDLDASGLMAAAATRYRVIAFDRPGFGHSSRPRTTVWTAAAQAELLRKALLQLGVSRFLVFGHSWGACVAVRLASDHPEAVSGLVLASGYYFPDFRADAVALGGPAIPVVGDVLRYTVSPLLARLTWRQMLRNLFAPAKIPAKFRAFPRDMALRPSQLRAAAAESMLMIPAAYGASERYGALTMPVALVAGEGDRVVDIDKQSRRLHDLIAGSSLRRVKAGGHMVHHTATAEVMSAIEEVANAAHDAGERLAPRSRA